MPTATHKPAPWWQRWLPWLALGVFWLGAVRAVSAEWRVNPEYNYGWAVPFLCVWLLVRRWRTRPATADAPHPAFPIALAALAAGWLPVRLILEAFPNWRPVLWAAGAGVVALTLLFFHRAGGRPWLRHFAFPACFFFVALPWPSPLEQTVRQSLLNLNTGLVVRLLTLFGEPAVQHGNLIATARGTIGLDEACSGMRSLQAVLAIALLIGEFYRLRPMLRIGLLVSGWTLAFAANAARAFALAWTGAQHGVAAVAAEHDPAGLATLALCVIGLWIMAAWLRPRAPASGPAAAPPRGQLLPVGAGVALGATLLLGEIGTAWWYRSRESAAPVAALPVSWPEDRSGFHRLEIRPEVRSILGLDTGEAAAWRDVVGGDWVIHRLRWEPRPLARAILAQYHSPDVCLPAAGCIQKADLGLVSIAGPGGTVSLRGYEFEESGHPLFVFYALREDWMSEDQEPGRSLPWARLRLVWQGRRSSGQTAIHVALRGASDAAEAIARARRELPRVFFPAALPAAGAQAS